MAKLGVYFLVIVVLCQSVAVFSRQIDFNMFEQDHLSGAPRKVRQATTTTTPTPVFNNCFTACNTRVTPQYSPVCGSNGQSYSNAKRLECAQRCGLSVTIAHIGTCGSSAGGK